MGSHHQNNNNMWQNKRFVKVFQTVEEAYRTLERDNYITYHTAGLGIFVEFTTREFAEKAGGKWAFPEEETTPTGNSGTSPFPTAKEAKERSDEARVALHEQYWKDTLRQLTLEKIENAISKGERITSIDHPNYHIVKEELGPLGYRIIRLVTCLTIEW